MNTKHKKGTIVTSQGISRTTLYTLMAFYPHTFFFNNPQKLYDQLHLVCSPSETSSQRGDVIFPVTQPTRGEVRFPGWVCWRRFPDDHAINCPKSSCSLKEKLCTWISLVSFMAWPQFFFNYSQTKVGLDIRLPAHHAALGWLLLPFPSRNLQVCHSGELWPPFEGMPATLTTYEIHSRYQMI